MSVITTKWLVSYNIETEFYEVKKNKAFWGLHLSGIGILARGSYDAYKMCTELNASIMQRQQKDFDELKECLKNG